MSDILIIGFGNPIRSDDGLGWIAVEILADTIMDHHVSIIAVHQLTLDLAEKFLQSRHVILIDAAVQQPAGTIRVHPLSPDTTLPFSLLHHMTPVKMLTYVNAMYGQCPPATLFSVAGDNFGFGESLSPSVAEALPELIEKICFLVQRLNDE